MNVNEYNKKLLYKIYREFFDKEPDFSKGNIKNITIEIQSMLYILDSCGVIFFANKFFKNRCKNLEVPISMDIQDIIVDQLVDNDKILNDDSLHFTEITKRMIAITGSVIRNEIKDTQNQTEALRVISNILYIKKEVCPNNNDGIRQLTNCELEDLNIEEKVIDAITNELCKTNFDENNIENIKKMIDESSIDTYSMFISESENGKNPVITKKNRKNVASSLLK